MATDARVKAQQIQEFAESAVQQLIYGDGDSAIGIDPDYVVVKKTELRDLVKAILNETVCISEGDEVECYKELHERLSWPSY